MSGNVGSYTNTRYLLQLLLSWFMAPTLAQLNIINLYVRKTGHLLAYGFMYFLWFRAFRGHANYGPWRACIWSLGFCLLFASLDERRQLFYPSRTGNIRDVLLDLSGASLAALITFAVWTPRDHAKFGSKISFWHRPYLFNYWLPPVLWSLTLLTLPVEVISVKSTLGPLNWFVSWFTIVDLYDLRILNILLWKIGQFMAFGILYFLWFRAFQIDAGASRSRACVYALALCLLTSLLAGIYQIPAGTRMGDPWEIILDMSGASLAALIIGALWTPRRHTYVIPGIAGKPMRRENNR
jgi:VanZ family protein